MSKKNKIIIGIIIGIPVAVLLIGLLAALKLFDPSRYNYENSIYVATKHETKDTISYYEVNEFGYKRKAKTFDYNDNDIFYFNKCFDSYIDRENHGVFNKRLDSCKIVDENDNEIIIDDTLNDIINDVSRLRHDIMESRSKIVKTNNTYYVSIELNVNWHSPYDLYKYDDNKLNHIAKFESEELIGIKEKS